MLGTYEPTNSCSKYAAKSILQLHARLGELGYIAASPEGQSPEDTQSLLTESIRRFSRSIELCDDYLRGYFGLKLVGPIQNWFDVSY